MTEPAPIDLRMARLRFDDETSVGLEHLALGRDRWGKRLKAIRAQMSARAANTLWVIGVWSPGELRRALKRTPNLLGYVNGCGSTTVQELVRWSAAECLEEPCPCCHGSGIIFRPVSQTGATARGHKGNKRGREHG